MKLLSSEVTLYLYKSSIKPRMEYHCHAWACAPSSYLELLDKLQKRICRTTSPSLAASLEPLAQAKKKKKLFPQAATNLFFNQRSSLFFFGFFCFFLFLFVCCFLKLKVYIVTHIQWAGKWFFAWSISGNKTSFFWPHN